MKSPLPRLVPVLLALAPMSAPLAASETPAASRHEFFAYFGTGRGGPETGFSVGSFNSDTGVLTAPNVVPTTSPPNIFIFSPDGRFLYTCHAVATFQGQPGGGVSAFSVDPLTGGLTALNSVLSGGRDPGYLSLDRTGRFLFVANYNGGNFSVHAIQPDGTLGARTAFEQHTGKSVHPSRQGRAYAEAIFTDATNRFLICTDLGLDKIFVYRFDDKTGMIRPEETTFATIAPGAGPRHAVFGRGEKFLHVIGEINNTITTYAWDAAKGALTEVQVVPMLPENFQANNNAAEILVHANGKFLYASNRGHDSLVVFSINEQTGHLSLVQHVPTGGRTPRCFSFDPTGKWIIVSNQAANHAAVFGVDATTGRLTPHREPVAVPSPLQLQFLAKPVQI